MIGTNGTDRVASEAPEDLSSLVRGLRAAFQSGRTRPLEWRLRQLDGIGRMLRERERDIVEALHQDLGKPELEAWTAEIQFLSAELKLIRQHLRSWLKPERVGTPMLTQPGSSRIHREPLGVVLIIGPWNYPFQLVIAPLLGALAGGNCAVVKPSEVSEHTSKVVKRWLPEYVDPECVRVVEGGVPETTALLDERFDHVFYTGNGSVGRIVMMAAAKHLTPVTLELGGKSPCIVDASADLAVAVRRICWGKFYNAGQTCVAPDYVLAHERVHDALLEGLARTLREFYGPDPKKSPDFGRIINERHHRRLMKLLPSGQVVVGGEADLAERYLAPTVLKEVPPESPVMGEEIFGPILPVLRVPSLEAAIDFVNARDKPLALYVFARDRAAQRQVVERTSSGAVTVNHAWMHLTVPGLPFGGVGESGMGAYRGRLTFETFVHRKAVLTKPTFPDPTLLYPPYTPTKAKWIRRLL